MKRSTGKQDACPTEKAITLRGWPSSGPAYSDSPGIKGLPSQPAGAFHGMSESSVVTQPARASVTARIATAVKICRIILLLQEDRVADFDRTLLPIRQNVANREIVSALDLLDTYLGNELTVTLHKELNQR